jgi:hypothetical protein
MIRGILGLVVGLVAAVAVIFAIEAVGHAVYPTPAGLDPDDPEAVRAAMASLPLGALLFVLGAWTAGALVQGAVAAKVSGGRVAPAIGAMGLLASTAFNLWAIPHPGWFSAAAVAALLAGSAIGISIGAPRRT